MTTNKLLHFIAWFTVGVVTCFPTERLIAQAADPNESLQIVLNYGELSERHLLGRGGVFDPISLHANQEISFVTHFPREQSGQRLTVGVADGGEIITELSQDDAVVPGDGIAFFTFRPGPTRGLYRVVVQLPGELHLLRFYVID